MPIAGFGPRTVSPATQMRPPESDVRPPMAWNSVDLPQPEGPMIETNSPAATSKLMPSTATMSSLPVS